MASDDPGGTITRAARHFAHKVDVERSGDLVRVRIAAGAFELEPADGAIEIRLSPVDEASAPRLRAVVASHLERFDRTGGLVEWAA